ncbi:hypothetical protein H1V43_23785 [Streptomyces sp. PSKA54]|uniref:Sortase n=1 Tax=Streptomyces himalayensis subsp. aureolus TaxID=2758039 RepID=A0A7W2D3X9_9ACTN|nr:hypothetical protein [Streptomyces himalayensis]MBA4864319.1 hypothetical protein [Streptomyces himalayensis subsp. aureolus]
MRRRRMLTGTVLAAAAAGLSAAPALAGDATTLDLYPSTTAPGATVSVNTKACGTGETATGDASAVGAGMFTLAPSAHDGEAIGQFKVPPSAQPGTYEIVAKCFRGDKEMAGDLKVILAVAATQQPKGRVETGVGGALGPDPVQTAAGVAALAVAAAGGTWLLHRRARGDRI